MGKAKDLLRHAEHCRCMARTVSDERTRLILRAMANELDQQANEEDARDQSGYVR